MRVLVADDERDTLLTLGILLRSEGFEVRLIRDGAKVLGEVSSFRPDAVLLDIGMPDPNGYEVAEKLREYFGRDYPVLIAVTAYSAPADRREAQRCGFDHHVAKPYDPQALLRLLGSVNPGNPS